MLAPLAVLELSVPGTAPSLNRTQGGAWRATLGCFAESRWDSICPVPGISVVVNDSIRVVCGVEFLSDFCRQLS